MYELTKFGVYFSTSRSSRRFGLKGPMAHGLEALRCMSIAAWKGYDHEEHWQATRRGLLEPEHHNVRSHQFLVETLHFITFRGPLLFKNQACAASPSEKTVSEKSAFDIGHLYRYHRILDTSVHRTNFLSAEAANQDVGVKVALMVGGPTVAPSQALGTSLNASDMFAFCSQFRCTSRAYDFLVPPCTTFT